MYMYMYMYVYAFAYRDTCTVCNYSVGVHGLLFDKAQISPFKLALAVNGNHVIPNTLSPLTVAIV